MEIVKGYPTVDPRIAFLTCREINNKAGLLCWRKCREQFVLRKLIFTYTFQEKPIFSFIKRFGVALTSFFSEDITFSINKVLSIFYQAIDRNNSWCKRKINTYIIMRFVILKISQAPVWSRKLKGSEVLIYLFTKFYRNRFCC